MYRPISVLNVSCPHAVAHPYLTVVTVTIYSYLKLGYPLSPYYRRHLVSASCAVFLADQFLTCVYVHVLSLPLAIRFSCLIAMATNTMEVNGYKCNVVSVPCCTGQSN